MDICTVRRSTQPSCDLGYSDELLHTIGRMIPFHWKKLGVYLSLPLTRLDEMLKTKYAHEMALEVLQAWWRRTTPHSRWGELHYALAAIHRHDLVKQTQEFYRENAMDYNSPTQSCIDRLMFMLAEAIPTSWKELGVYLSVPDEKIAEIGQQPVHDTSQHTFKVLKMWQVSPNASHHQLIRIMGDDMKRADVTRFILKHFENPRQGRTVCDCNECE